MEQLQREVRAGRRSSDEPAAALNATPGLWLQGLRFEAGTDCRVSVNHQAIIPLDLQTDVTWFTY